MKKVVLQEILNRVFYISLLVSCTLTMIKCYDSIDTTWTVCLLLCLLAVVLIIPISHLHISLTCSKLNSRSTELLLFIAYSISISIFTFVLLLGLKLDDVFSGSWYTVFIPVWLMVFTYSCFVVFMFPGMMEPTVNLSREAWILMAFTLAFIVSSIMLPFWIEDNGISHIWMPLFPILLVCFASLCSFWYTRCKVRGEKPSVFGLELINYTSIIPLCTTLIIGDEIEGMPIFVYFLMLYKSIILHWVKEEKENYLKSKEEKGQIEYQEV